MKPNILESIELSYRIFGMLPSSRLFPLTGGNFLYASGIPFAGENWAWISKNNEMSGKLQLEFFKETVNSAVETFQGLSLPFALPILPKIPEEMSAFLDNIGLLVREKFTAMFLDLEDKKAISLLPLRFEKSEPLVWSSVCWRGFGADSREKPHEAFEEFAKNAYNNEMIHMFTAYHDNSPCGSALLTETESAHVLFYFAVIPEKRRLGIGSAMIDRIIEFAKHKKRFLTLLATPVGRFLYEMKGFKAAESINIRSFSEDVV